MRSLHDTYIDWIATIARQLYQCWRRWWWHIDSVTTAKIRWQLRQYWRLPPHRGLGSNHGWRRRKFSRDFVLHQENIITMSRGTISKIKIMVIARSSFKSCRYRKFRLPYVMQPSLLELLLLFLTRRISLQSFNIGTQAGVLSVFMHSKTTFIQ